jgi:hypothetical protein
MCEAPDFSTTIEFAAETVQAHRNLVHGASLESYGPLYWTWDGANSVFLKKKLGTFSILEYVLHLFGTSSSYSFRQSAAVGVCMSICKWFYSSSDMIFKFPLSVVSLVALFT